MNTVTMLDATGNPVMVDASVDPNFGVPSSINPALIDPNTGKLLPGDQPVVKHALSPLAIGGIAIGLYLLYRHFFKK